MFQMNVDAIDLIMAGPRGEWRTGSTPGRSDMNAQPTIEQRNRQHVLEMLTMFYAGDIEGALAKCSDDIDHFVSAPVDLFPHLGVRRGKHEVRTMWETILHRYWGMRHEVRSIIAEGDRVAVDLRVFIRKRDNDRMLQFDIAMFFTLQDGKLTRVRELADTYDLVQQVIERDLGPLMEPLLPHGSASIF
jgi:ketosteroid isomerase-like protein